MTPALAAALAAVLTLPLGHQLRHRLNTLGYRHPEEATLPHPGPRTWVPWILAGAMAALTWRYTDTGHADLLMVLIPFTVASVWLTAVDLDVQRIPYKITLPTTLAVLVGVGLVALTRQDPTLVLTSVAGGALAYGTYWLLHKISKTGIGYGDVRYASLVGLNTGTLSLNHAWWALLTAALTAALWAGITRPQQRVIPYGPWLALGALVSLQIG